MSDKSQDELRKRFDRSQDRGPDREESADEENDTADRADPSEGNEMDETDETDQTNTIDERGERGERGETNPSPGEASGGLKGRKQVAMYLPADLRRELSEFYEELDARSTLAGDGGLQKNREFYEGMVEFVLDHRQAFADSLDIEIDEK